MLFFRCWPRRGFEGGREEEEEEEEEKKPQKELTTAKATICGGLYSRVSSCVIVARGKDWALDRI